MQVNTPRGERLRIRWIDHVTPTAVLLVSRAWVLREVGGLPGIDERRRAELVDELVGYEPQRRHGLRNNFIAWLIMLGGTGLAHLSGLPPWLGFVAGLLVVLMLAREVAVRSLRWRLAQLTTHRSREA
jgi:hypothetical protein